MNISPSAGSFLANQTLINFTNIGNLEPLRSVSAFGVEMFVGGNFNMTGGSFILNNSGSFLNSFGSGFAGGVFVNVSGDMTLNGGNVSMTTKKKVLA